MLAQCPVVSPASRWSRWEALRALDRRNDRCPAAFSPYRCLSFGHCLRCPTPAHQAGRAVFPRPALRRKHPFAHGRSFVLCFKGMELIDGHDLISVDGTELFSSRSVSCGNCYLRRKQDRGVEHFHRMICANLADTQTPPVLGNAAISGSEPIPVSGMNGRPGHRT